MQMLSLFLNILVDATVNGTVFLIYGLIFCRDVRVWK